MRFNLGLTTLYTSYDLPTSTFRSYNRTGTTNTTPTIITLLSLYFLAFTYYHFVSYRDPTSYFFDKTHAYSQHYSKHRIEQAAAFIKNENDGRSSHNPLPLAPPRLCVGIATVKRRGEQYVSMTVGSLLEGMSANERSSIFLNVLIAHTDPKAHPNYEEKWMQTLPDRVLSYDRDSPDFERIVAWEQGGWYRNKTIYDYTYLLKNCYDTGAEYVLMIEDDTIAAQGWYEKAMKALQDVLTKMKNQSTEWVYLRLFYVEDLLGWNSENWFRYLSTSFVVWLAATVSLLFIKTRFRRQLENFTAPCLAFISLIFIPMCIGLHFMAGRQTMWPIPVGISKMNKYGCCSQALVFPRSIIPLVLSKSDLTTDWLVDMMIEKIADGEHWMRWVLVPALFQHIGATSSKGYGFDDNARSLWNFRFEDQSW